MIVNYHCTVLQYVAASRSVQSYYSLPGDSRLLRTGAAAGAYESAVQYCVLNRIIYIHTAPVGGCVCVWKKQYVFNSAGHVARFQPVRIQLSDETTTTIIIIRFIYLSLSILSIYFIYLSIFILVFTPAALCWWAKKLLQLPVVRGSVHPDRTAAYPLLKVTLP